MNKKKKIATWIAVFSLLSAFTIVVSFGVLRNTTKVALAQSIEQNPGSSNRYVEMLAGGVANNSGDNQHLVCEVSQSQFDHFQSTYGNTHKWDFTAHGHPVSVVTIYSKSASQQLIRDYLNSTGNQYTNCFVPKIWDIYFLIFNANLS